MQMWSENKKHNKVEYIRQHLGYEYNSKLFKDTYNSFKDSPNFEKMMNFLIFEKNVPYDNEIKELIKEDTKIQKSFLYRKLNANLENKNTTSKPKL